MEYFDTTNQCQGMQTVWTPFWFTIFSSKILCRSAGKIVSHSYLKKPPYLLPSSKFWKIFLLNVTEQPNPREQKVHSLLLAFAGPAIVHRNHLFQLYQKDKSSDSKVKFREASNRCKRVLEADKLAYANEKKRVHYFPETWLSWLLANC